MALNSSLSPDDRDLLIRTIIPDAQGKSDDEIAQAARDIVGRVGVDGQSVSDVVLGRGNYPAWQTAAPLSHPNDSDAYVRVARAITPAVQNDAGGESEAEFEKRLGLSSNPPPGVVKAPKLETQDEFEKRLGVGSAAPAEPAKAEQTTGPLAAANAFTGGFVRGIPILGPVIDAGTRRAAAAARSVMYGTPYADELAAVNKYATGTAAANPNIELAGNVAGGINALVPAAVMAPTVMGLTGSLGQRMVLGGASNAGINALDAAVRSGGDISATGTGAAIGGAFGLGAPVAGRAVGAGMNALMRNAVDPMTTYLANRAAELGIPIRPPQMSTSPFINKLDQMTSQLPGAVTPRLAAEQQSAVTRAVSRTFGEDTDTITPQVMRGAKRRLGQEFDDVTQAMNIAHDQPLADRLTGIQDEANRYITNEGERRAINNHVEDVYRGFDPDSGMMEGQTYHSIVRKGAPLDRAIKSGDSNISYYATQIRSALDDAAERWSTPEMSDRLSAARMQYKNMKTVEPLVTKGQPGEISPLALQNRVNASFRNRAYSGAGDLGDIADIAQQFMRQPRDSGTPVGNVVMNMLARHGTLVGAGLLGGAGAGGYYAAGDNPLKGLGLGLAGLAGTAATARGVSALLNNPAMLSGIIQRAPYLAPAVANRLRITVNPLPPDQRQQQ